MTERSVLGGRYELGDALGRGGMAEVRRGLDLRLHRPVAVKLLTRELSADPLFRARFAREAQSAASLNHPSIVAVFDTAEEVDPDTGVSMPYIVMELVEGKTLRAVLSGGHALPPQRALEITSSVLDALTHSHDAGIIHRDIKPANVMLTPSGTTKVMDFGIARAVTDTSTDLTQTAAVIGTAQYLSPEQARGEKVDLRSDIYSTGCLLYELLVGRPPFVGESAISVVYQHVREEPVPPSRHNPLIHPGIDAIVLKALAKDPDDRYPSARAMSEDISRALAGEQTVAATPTGTAATATAPTVAAIAGATAVLPASDDSTPVGTQPSPVPVAAAPLAPAEPAARRRQGRWLLVTALVLLLMGGATYGLYRHFDGASGTAAIAGVDVPDVIGKSRAKAESTLRDAHLTPRITEVSDSNGAKADSVLTQDPQGGLRVPADSVVNLTVVAGAKKGTIPTGLTGSTLDAAKQELKDAGFDKVRTRKDDDPPKGTNKDQVTSVDPGEGTSVDLDSRVTLSYAPKDEPSEGSTSPTSSPTEASSTTDPTSDPTSAKPTDTTSTKPTDTTSTKPTETSTSTSTSTESPGRGKSSKSKKPKSTKSPKPGKTKSPKDDTSTSVS